MCHVVTWVGLFIAICFPTVHQHLIHMNSYMNMNNIETLTGWYCISSYVKRWPRNQSKTWINKYISISITAHLTSSWVNEEFLSKSLWFQYLKPSNPQIKTLGERWEAAGYCSYHGNGSPWRGMVFTGMNPDVPAGLEHVDDRLHADVELWHPHHLHTTLRILHEAHLSARLQRNTWKERKEEII